jgi:hypothetical protein
VAADVLKINHHIGEFLVLNLFSIPFDGDRPVLAKNTPKITVGKEDGSGSFLSHERYLFTKMWMCRIDHELGRSPAKPPLAIVSVDATSSGAKFAVLEN